jgi:hypothetical protein
MAMNATTLTNLMDTKAQAVMPLTDAEARAGRKKMFAAVAEAVIEHLISSLQVTILPLAAGLQTTVSLGSPTGPPLAPVPLPPGSIS